MREEFIDETESIQREIKSGHFSKSKTADDLFAGISDE